MLRLLDANANRAREALRVMEDYARFVLNDAGLSAALKHIRHGLADATRLVLPEAILHRDTPGDVGIANKTRSELTREDLADVVTAAGKRLGEALRSIEEFLKTCSPSDAAKVEAARYAAYDAEQRLARTLGRGTRFAGVRLYVLITEKLCRLPWLEAAEEAILGGADCLQLREKELDGGELLKRARQFTALCRQYDVISVINDRPDVAMLAEADGVHVGQDDLPAIEVRKLLGPEKIIGVSTHRIEQARQAVLDGADYIGVGPFFRSNTKPRDFTAGPEYAVQAAREVPIPSVAIAGITAENVDEVLATGIRAVAISSAVISSDDPRAAAERIKRRLVGQTFLSADSRQAEAGHMKVRDRKPVGQAFLPAVPEQAPKSGHPEIRDREFVGQTFLPAIPKPAPQSDHLEIRDTEFVGQAFLPATSEQAPKSGQLEVNDRESVGQAFLSAIPEQAPQSDHLEITHRRLPHWRLAGSVYFITFRVAGRTLDAVDRGIILDHIRSGDANFYTLFAAVIMPDHAHVLLRPAHKVDLSRITKGIKGVSARMLNIRWNRAGALWQDESWDRIMRDQAEFNEKLKYMLENPVKKGLVVDPWEWDGWYYNAEAR